MPITPYHFGPGAAIYAAAPRQVSFLAFCAANVLIDLEPLHCILTHCHQLHHFVHTILGVTVVFLAILLIYKVALKLMQVMSMPDINKQLPFRKVAIGAALGSYSHIILDSMMHHDVHPFAPFSDANPIWQIISTSALLWSCLAAGAAGILILGIRWLLSETHAL